jgi:methionyl-tRNA formyltransferase
MGLTKEMDAGPIFAQQVIQLSGNEYQKELYKKLGDLGSKLIVDLLPEIINGTITPQPQDNARITFAPLIQKEDARIVWVEKTALEIDRQIRAYNYWPQARGIIELTQNKSQEIELIITRAKSHASNSHLPAAAVFVENNHLFVGCKSGSLEILELKVPGKSVMSASDFIRGYIKNR